MLEFLAELFNASNRESDYAQALVKLFDLYCTKHDYQKAGRVSGSRGGSGSV